MTRQPERVFGNIWSARTIGLLVAIVCVASIASAQGITADRRINWQPGVPGGIPTRAVCSSLTSTATPAQINSAIAACPAGQTVSLGAGTYTLDSQITITKGVTLKGAGPTATILRCTAGWHCIQMGNFPSTPSTVAVSGSPAKGATSLTVASVSGLSVNDYVAIDQLNDEVEVVNDQTAFGADECRSGANTRCLGQIVKITAINGTTLTISPSLHHSFAAAQTPQVWEVSMTTGAGVEDLAITRPTFVGGGYDNVKMVACAGCWVKNIQSTTPDFWHVEFDRTIWSEARDSYFNDGFNQGTGGQAYGAVSNLFATDNLIENNVFRHLRHSMVVENGATGNVYGYNYSLECYQGENWLATDMNSHGAHTTMNLWEGNIGCKVYGDNAHGSSSYNTVYRSQVNRESFPAEFSGGITQALRAVDIEVFNRYWNIVGNVLGKSGQTFDAYDPGGSRSAGSGRYAFTFGYFSDGQSSQQDGTISSSTFRHGNFDYATRSTIWDASTSDHSLPASLYLTSKPSFFGGLPWPAIGSDLSPMSGTIPARERYEGRAIPPPSGGAPSAPTGLRIIP